VACAREVRLGDYSTRAARLSMQAVAWASQVDVEIARRLGMGFIAAREEIRKADLRSPDERAAH
jgi:hypothetical protein